MSDALADRVERDAKLTALRAAIDDYEVEFGVIGVDDVAAQERADRVSAVVVRGEVPGGVSM